MGKANGHIIEPLNRKKDRDGLHERRGYWHYRILVDGKWRSFSTETKNYNQAKKVRAAAIKDLQDFGACEKLPAYTFENLTT